LQRLGSGAFDDDPFLRPCRPRADDAGFLATQQVRCRYPNRGRRTPRSTKTSHRKGHCGGRRGVANGRCQGHRISHAAPTHRRHFAYKFETPDGVIVFSSDTNYNPRLAEFARGADVLVHECLYLPAVDRLVVKTKNGATLKQHLLASHTTTEDVGRIAAA